MLLVNRIKGRPAYKVNQTNVEVKIGLHSLLFNSIPKPQVDVEALYQKPKKQRRQQQQPSRVEKIEEEPPEVNGDNGDTNKVNCGAPTTTTAAAVAKAPEGTALAAAKRLAPLAEQVELRVQPTN